jgi:hypothetical protein
MAFRCPKFLRVVVWTVARPPLLRIAIAQAYPTRRITMKRLFLAAALATNPAGSRRSLGAAELHSAGFLGHLGPFVLAEFRAAGIPARDLLRTGHGCEADRKLA